MSEHPKPIKTEEYRALAERCFRQARATLEPEAAGILRRIGKKYLAKAGEIPAQPIGLADERR